MKELRYTLLTDGPTDDALIPLLNWLLRGQGVACAVVPTWADLRHLRPKPSGLSERIWQALELYPCDLLFVHRDTENQPPSWRQDEIQRAIDVVHAWRPVPPTIPVIPVRMQEAWYLFEERAIRRAAGNPNGKIELDLPRTDELETVPDPKKVLFHLLREASGLHGRRRKKFSTIGIARRVAEFLDDFAPLRVLAAFTALEARVSQVVSDQSWNRLDEAQRSDPDR